MMNGGKRKIELIEYVGLFLVAFSFLMLVVNPGGIGNLFRSESTRLNSSHSTSSRMPSSA